MKNLKIFLSALILVVIATSCTYAQKGVITNKTFPIQSFSSIKSDVVANVIYTQSNKVSVRAEGDKERVDNLDVTVKKDVLKIDHKGKLNSKNKKKLTIYISSPSINEIDVDGVGNWSMEGEVKTDNLKINFDGVGNFEALELESNNIKANYEGVGNLKLGGTTNFVEITSEGVGSVNTQNLIAKNAVIISSGVGSVKCYASESIDLNNTGVGSVTYYGNPTVKNMKNSGIGKIKQGN
ncbi:MAG: head GIN domain-containing protein [Dysgonamonadaceae bacterium]